MYIARIHFSSLYIIPRRFLDCARLYPCSARNDMLRRGCKPRFRGLLKAEFAGAIVYFFLPGFTVAKSCFANHTSIALFIIRLVITEYVVFTIM